MLLTSCTMCRREGLPIAPTFTAKAPIPTAHVTLKGAPCTMIPRDAYDEEVKKLLDTEDQFWSPELQRGSDPASVPQPRGPEGNAETLVALAGSQALPRPDPLLPGNVIVSETRVGGGGVFSDLIVSSSVPEAVAKRMKKNKSRKRKQNGKASSEAEIDDWDPA